MTLEEGGLSQDPKPVKKSPCSGRNTLHLQIKSVCINVIASPISLSVSYLLIPPLPDISRRRVLQTDRVLQGKLMGPEGEQGLPHPEFAHHKEPSSTLSLSFLTQTLFQWKTNGCVCPR